VAFFYTGIHVAHAHAHVVPMVHQHDVTSVRYLEDGIEAFTLPPSPGEAALLQTAGRMEVRLAQDDQAGDSLRN